MRPYRASVMGKKRRRLASRPKERRSPSGDATAFGKGASWIKTVSGTPQWRRRAFFSHALGQIGAEASRTALKLASAGAYSAFFVGVKSRGELTRDISSDRNQVVSGVALWMKEPYEA